MVHVAMLLMTQLSAGQEFSARLETLRFHVERLNAVTVPAELETEKKSKLAELEERVKAGAATEDEFNDLYRAIDAVRMWLWDHAAERPGPAHGEYAETDEKVTVKTPALELTIAKSDLSMTVNTPSHQWRFEPCNNKDVQLAGKRFSLLDAGSRTFESFDTGYSVGLVATFTEFPEVPGFALRLCANVIGSEIVFELAAEETNDVLSSVNWPKAIELGNSENDLSVIPRMQGMLLPGNWEQRIHAVDLCNSRSLYMPWWGQIHDGHGVLTILETTDDAGAEYGHLSGGPTRISPRWFPSLGRLRYQRTIRYVFDDEATYVTMAKRYRRYVQERGQFVSLEEKRARTPALDEVIGSPVVHIGALYHFVQEASLFNKERIEANHSLRTFDQLADGLRTLKANGLDHAYVHLDGWGFYGYDNGHPDVLPVGEEQGGWDGLRRFSDTCSEIGYFFAVHDQYRDLYFNAASFDDRLVLTNLEGKREEHSTWCGGPQTVLSPRFAPGYVRRNHDLFAEHGIGVRGAYLDVFAVVPLEESAQSAHPMTRTECAQHRRECFDLLRARGYVVSSEEPADYLVRSLDLVHHGPYPTFPNLGGGDATGIPAPLFNLVYHDSILLPWEMGEDGGWGVPKGDAGWLHCLLNAGLPYAGVGAGPDQLARVHEATALARHCGLLEMTNHEFLDDTNRSQRTTFSDGTRVTVDFDTKDYEVQYGG